MATPPLFRLLCPNAPLDRRTEGDAPQRPDFLPRARAMRAVRPGLGSPSLVSSYAGSIDRILFCFPNRMINDASLVEGYKSVISALRVGTRFIVVHNEDGRSIVEGWFTEASHPPENVELVPVPDFAQLTDWAEDPYVSLGTAKTPTSRRSTRTCRHSGSSAASRSTPSPTSMASRRARASCTASRST